MTMTSDEIEHEGHGGNWLEGKEARGASKGKDIKNSSRWQLKNYL